MQAGNRDGRRGFLKGLIRGIIGFNAVIALVVLLFALVSMGSLVSAAPEDATAAPAGGLNGTVALAAALATGVGALGAGLAVGMTGSAALGTIAERPESFGRALIFVGLAEGIAIYGLIVSFLILQG
jgi:V/A-type H+/Na+-transporting ATPase subunit K